MTTKAAIIKELDSFGILNVSTLAALIKVAQPTCSEHLQGLINEGSVICLGRPSDIPSLPRMLLSPLMPLGKYYTNAHPNALLRRGYIPPKDGFRRWKLNPKKRQINSTLTFKSGHVVASHIVYSGLIAGLCCKAMTQKPLVLPPWADVSHHMPWILSETELRRLGWFHNNRPPTHTDPKLRPIPDLMIYVPGARGLYVEYETVAKTEGRYRRYFSIFPPQYEAVWITCDSRLKGLVIAVEEETRKARGYAVRNHFIQPDYNVGQNIWDIYRSIFAADMHNNSVTFVPRPSE